MSTSTPAPDGGRIRLRDGAVAWRLVAEELVALDLNRSTYLGVNRTGALVWPALAEGTTMNELVELIVARFDIDRVRAAGDLESFLTGLADRGLIEGMNPPSGTG